MATASYDQIIVTAMTADCVCNDVCMCLPWGALRSWIYIGNNW